LRTLGEFTRRLREDDSGLHKEKKKGRKEGKKEGK
jgi:hypothetical protein